MISPRGKIACLRIYLSVGWVGALSCNRAIQAAARVLSYRPRLQAAGPACTAGAAVHAGQQGVPSGPGLGSLLLRPQGPRTSERHTWGGGGTEWCLDKGLFHIWSDPPLCGYVHSPRIHPGRWKAAKINPYQKRARERALCRHRVTSETRSMNQAWSALAQPPNACACVLWYLKLCSLCTSHCSHCRAALSCAMMKGRNSWERAVHCASMCFPLLRVYFFTWACTCLTNV